MTTRSSPGIFSCGQLVGTITLIAALTAPANGQNPAMTDDMLNGPSSLRELTATRHATSPNTGLLVLNVFAQRNGVHIDRQAILKLVDRATQTVRWETTDERAEGVFYDVPYGSYDVEISAVGYLSTHREVQIIPTVIEAHVEVVLQRDPAAVNFDVANNVMSPSARKEAKKAVAALKARKLDQAQKHLEAANKGAQSDPSLNFLVGYLYFQKKDFAHAMNYLVAATTINPHNPQALTLLGRAGLEQKDFPAARSALEQAILADEENWLPHDLLADTYLHEKDYTKARDEAHVAIAKGKTAASSAQLILGEALLNLGQLKEGVQALNVFLEQSPQHPIAGQVRSLLADLAERESNVVPADSAAPSSIKLTGADPLMALPAPTLSVKAWQPLGVDEIKVAVAPDIACPSEKVIGEAGKRTQELVNDVARFAAIEDLLHQNLDAYGTAVRSETRKYNYVASISEPEPGYLAVDEYRTDNLPLTGYPDNIASTGFAALALVFHPHMRDNFDVVCEGLGDWRGQASWLIHFRQREDRPNRMHSYKVGNTYHTVKLKGRAWILADRFQIVRIEAEMVSPMPEIQLLSEHQVVEYGPVLFEKKKTTLWLPKSAEIYFDFRKHRYYRRHSFDHYMLFSTDTEEKAKPPRDKAAEKKS